MNSVSQEYFGACIRSPYGACHEPVVGVLSALNQSLSNIGSISVSIN
jgi:hypothetical protein